MKIYLAGSMAGGRDYADGLVAINKVLIELGHIVLTPFVVDPKINEQRFPKLKGVKRARAIFEEDIELVTESDTIIAEVSQPSTGVGTELGYALGLIRLAKKRKPILLLRHKSLEKVPTSNLIIGNPHATFSYYDKGSVGSVVWNFLNKLSKKK